MGTPDALLTDFISSSRAQAGESWLQYDSRLFTAAVAAAANLVLALASGSLPLPSASHAIAFDLAAPSSRKRALARWCVYSCAAAAVLADSSPIATSIAAKESAAVALLGATLSELTLLGLWSSLPRTFTVGEAMLVAEGIAVFATDAVLRGVVIMVSFRFLRKRKEGRKEGRQKTAKANATADPPTVPALSLSSLPSDPATVAVGGDRIELDDNGKLGWRWRCSSRRHPRRVPRARSLSRARKVCRRLWQAREARAACARLETRQRNKRQSFTVSDERKSGEAELGRPVDSGGRDTTRSRRDHS